jgi:MFS family permease
MFYLTVGAATALGIFSLFLPHTPPSAKGPVSARDILGLDALVLLKDRSYLVFLICSMLICIPLAFYYQIAARMVEMMEFQKFTGFTELAEGLGLGDAIGMVMSFGQISEIFFMLVMPFFFVRLGVRWMLAVGMLAWVARYALFAFGAPEEIRWMVMAGILLHGICYDFFFVTGQIYTDRKAPRHLRGQAQGLLVLFTLGIGMFIGAQVAGRIEAHYTPAESLAYGAQVTAKGEEIQQLETRINAAPEAARAVMVSELAELSLERAALRKAELQAIEWKPLWGIPAGFAALVMVIFLVLFREKSSADVSAAPRVRSGAAK